jgi:hypothetical protein
MGTSKVKIMMIIMPVSLRVFSAASENKLVEVHPLLPPKESIAGFLRIQREKAMVEP